MTRVLLLAATALSAGCMTSRPLPGYAILFADDSARQYISPPCLEEHPEHAARFTRQTTVREMHSTWATGSKTDRYWPLSQCADEEGLVEKVRLWPLPEPASRVNPDGTWIW